MGINHLLKMLRDNECIEYNIPMSSLEGKRVSIDSYLYIYKYFFASISSFFKNNSVFDDDETPSCELFDSKYGALVYHKAVSDMVSYFDDLTREYKINFVFVFDGLCPESKNKYARERRNKVKEYYKNKLANAESRDEILKYIPYAFEFKTQIMREALISSLTEKSFEIIESKGEGERECCEMVRNDNADEILTNDTDCLAMGYDIIPRFNKGSFDKTNVKLFMKKMILNDESFKDLCILLGCDYNSSIKGIGPKTSIKYIKTYGKLESIPEIKDKLDILNIEECRRNFSWNEKEIKS